MLTNKSRVAAWVFAGAATVFFLSTVQAEETPTALTTSTKNKSSVQSGEVEGKFVVHEWGTFTTFSGSDGAFLDFRPLAQAHSDLPSYVFDRCSYSTVGRFLKARLRGRVRMETPVVYFYTDRIRSVDVSVNFPQGLLTEFYPPTRSISPPLNETLALGDGEPIGKSSLDWGTIDLIPKEAFVPSMKDAEVQSRIAERLMHSVLPHGPNEKHYAQARATDSALVHMTGVNIPIGHQRKNYFEKFLFYRGVGSFELPVEVTFQGDTPVFANHGVRPINSVILIESREGKVKATKIAQVAAGGEQPFAVTETMNLDQLADLVKKSLLAEGLYEKEASSMVNTWKDSWFAEEGRRVLYMVPGEVTEQLLPLNITPAPKERLRVLVGRMEIMSPSDENTLAQHVRDSIALREAFTKKHNSGNKNAPAYPIPKFIQSWGRMTEPALARISKIASELPLQREAEKLLIALQNENQTAKRN